MNHPAYKVIHNEYMITVVNSVRKTFLNIIFINSQLAWGKVPPYFFGLVKYSVFRIHYVPRIPQ